MVKYLVNINKKRVKDMKIKDFWEFIRENEEFFLRLSYVSDVKIDFAGSKYSAGDQWMADPFFLILKLFRAKFNEAGPSSDHEFTRLNKILYSNEIKPPFGKKEYDEYVNYENINQRILATLETTLGAVDGKFIVPTKEYSNKMFLDVSENMEKILSGLFIYESREARYYVDIYDRLTGFEVMLDNGTIFIPVKIRDVTRSALNEDKLRLIPTDNEVKILTMTENTLDEGDNIIRVSEEYTDSVANVVQYFKAFDICSDNEDFIMNVSESIYKLSPSDPIIAISGQIFPAYMADKMISTYLDHGPASIARLIDMSVACSYMSKIHRGVLIDSISKDISGDVIDLIKPYIDGSNDDYISRISELISRKNIELVSRMIRLNGDASSIRLYNKKMGYFKDFNVDKTGVMNELIPELGGFRFIASYSDLNRDNIPSGFATIEAFIIYAILKIVHGEFGNLPVFDRFCKDGVHMLGDNIVFSSKHDVYGLGGKHSYDGVLFTKAEIDVSLPKTRASRASASTAIDIIATQLKGFISSADDMNKLAAILLASSVAVPVLTRANKPLISIYGAGQYTKDGAKQKIFKGCFRNARVINTDSDFVVKNISDGGTSILVSDLNSSTQKILTKLGSERLGTETTSRFRNTDTTMRTINTSPILVFSNKPWIIDESIVFNFPARVSSEAGSFLYDTEDVSAALVSFVMHGHKKIAAIEDKYVAKIRKKLKKKNLNSKHPYIDFFEKILAGMCIAEATGYMDGWDFHDMMYAVFFNDENMGYSMNIEKMILSLQSGQSKVEDKFFDSKLRMNQHGDVVAVDKIFHTSYIDKEETDIYVLLFKRRDVYNKIKDDVSISFVEFSRTIDSLKGSIHIDNAMRNYRLGHDKNKTIYNWYVELFGKEKDEFAAIKINKKLFYGPQT